MEKVIILYFFLLPWWLVAVYGGGVAFLVLPPLVRWFFRRLQYKYGLRPRAVAKLWWRQVFDPLFLCMGLVATPAAFMVVAWRWEPELAECVGVFMLIVIASAKTSGKMQAFFPDGSELMPPDGG